jgi:transcriptional regulator with XRE-family HTH domain
MEFSNEILVRRIDTLVERTGKTREMAAKYARISKSTITGWKTSVPKVDHLVKVAEFYEVSIDSLIFGTEIEGIPEDIINLARRILQLEEPDRYEIISLLDIKLRRYIKAKTGMEKNA